VRSTDGRGPTTEGKAALGAYDHCVVFRLAGTSHTAALTLEGSVLFDPSGMGRPRKAWVVLTHAHQEQWKDLAVAALNL
jgi:hypothetical protein